MKRVIASAVLIALMASPAWTQHALVKQKLDEMNAKAPTPALALFEAAISEAVKARAAAGKGCAATGYKLSAPLPITGDRMIMQAVLSGQARNGWTTYAELKGCPADSQHRFMVIQTADGSLKALSVNRGRTNASPTTMRDTSMQAAMLAYTRARAGDAACQGTDLDMTSSRVASESADLGPEVYGVRYTGKWSEVWRFSVCGKSYDIPVEFTPDGDGGAYTAIKSENIVDLP